MAEMTASLPNALSAQGSARRSGPLFLRGVGGTFMDPYVTTYHDGVPVVHGQPSSLERLEGDQVVIHAGPQGGRFGRNSLAGVVEFSSLAPSLKRPEGALESTFGNYHRYEVNGRWSAPLITDQLGFGLAAGYSERDGFTENPAKDHDVDDRSAWYGKAQWLWTPDEDLEVRVILAGESSRDGGYTLNDLEALRKHPRRSFPMDVEGFNERDVLQATLQVVYHADWFDLTSVTGFRGLRGKGLADYDQEATFPSLWLVTGGSLFLDQAVRTDDSFLTLHTEENQTAFSQEFVFSNPDGKPMALGHDLEFSWQAGLSLLREDYQQETSLHMAAIEVLNFPFTPVPTRRFDSVTEMQTTAVGLSFLGKLAFRERMELSAGLRWDYEQREAEPYQFLQPVLDVATPGYMTVTRRDSASFSDVTPQAALTYHLSPTVRIYLSLAGGSTFQEDRTASGLGFSRAQSLAYEWGVQGSALRDRLHFGFSLFHTDLKNIQSNAWNPWPLAVGSNRSNTGSGDASVNGAEIQLHYQPVSGWEVYGQAGWMDSCYRSSAVFQDGANVRSLGGNPLPYAPEYTALVGTRGTWLIGKGLSFYAGMEVQFIGSYRYDGLDEEGQNAFTLTSFRAGLRRQNWFAEAFIDNALGTEYVAVASRQSSPYLSAAGNPAPRYVGESGSPVTLGLRMGLRF